jgi:predicted deacetylase
MTTNSTAYLLLEELKKESHHIILQNGYRETNQGEQQSQELEEFVMSSRKWAQTKLDWEDGHGFHLVAVLPPHA